MTEDLLLFETTFTYAEILGWWAFVPLKEMLGGHAYAAWRRTNHEDAEFWSERWRTEIHIEKAGYRVVLKESGRWPDIPYWHKDMALLIQEVNCGNA